MRVIIYFEAAEFRRDFPTCPFQSTIHSYDFCIQMLLTMKLYLGEIGGSSDFKSTNL